MHVDYPIADYEPMAATALTDAERWPLLTDGGRGHAVPAAVHPAAPRYNHACGDRLTAAARDRLRAYRSQLAGASRRTDWVHAAGARVYATVPRYRGCRCRRRWPRCRPTDRHDLLSDAAAHVPDDADLSEMIVYRTSGSRGPAATVPMTPEFCALDLPVMEHVLSSWGCQLRGRPAGCRW